MISLQKKQYIVPFIYVEATSQVEVLSFRLFTDGIWLRNKKNNDNIRNRERVKVGLWKI